MLHGAVENRTSTAPFNIAQADKEVICTSKKPFHVIDLEATGRNIRRLRLAKGLTVRDIQRYFHFDEPRAIYKWQRGESLPTVDNLLALSHLLNVSIEEILVSKSVSITPGSREKPVTPFSLITIVLFTYCHVLQLIVDIMLQIFQERFRLSDDQFDKSVASFIVRLLISYQHAPQLRAA